MPGGPLTVMIMHLVVRDELLRSDHLNTLTRCCHLISDTPVRWFAAQSLTFCLDQDSGLSAPRALRLGGRFFAWAGHNADRVSLGGRQRVTNLRQKRGAPQLLRQATRVSDGRW